MASPLIPSALDARTQAFPLLTPAQIERIRPMGRSRTVHSGEILFQPNDTAVPFFVLLSGQMEIVQPTLDGERVVTTHNPGGFTGEMTMISGQRCLVRGRVTEPGEFIELSGDALRALVAKDAELSEILMRAFILRRLELVRRGYGNAILMGSRHSAQTLQLREFFSRNGHPYTYIDLDTDRTAQELLDRFEVKSSEVPVVICYGRTVLRSPSIQKVADCLGFNVSIDNTHVRDLIIVGAGPAGLAAAVYAASEGLNVLMIEAQSPGGQAGSSSKIENYLGFPTGVSGEELAARATTQAQKFGANMMIARSVARLRCDSRPYQVELDTGELLSTRAIVIATGAQYNKPQLANLEKFEGEGVYYGATHLESQWCEGEQVAVVGGANSAGQAAVFLSQTAHHVHMLVRAEELSGTMSRYLIQRLTENPCIEIHFNTEIAALEGGSSLERILWKDRKTGEISTHSIQHVFLMTGALPRTEWLRGCVALDDKGFILTGRDLDAAAPDESTKWPLARAPQMLETSLPGVFAVGDARAGNVKRVASAVGEGAISVYMVHRALADL
ncbi:MAG: FAD-dependent oxidoreductase [Bryobacteraceae bacterium]|jgi:thioredoxin reductase (NADPH)